MKSSQDVIKSIQEIIDTDLQYLAHEGSEFIDRSTIRMIKKKLLVVISELEKNGDEQ